jgi:hypothetical protein
VPETIYLLYYVKYETYRTDFPKVVIQKDETGRKCGLQQVLNERTLLFVALRKLASAMK